MIKTFREHISQSDIVTASLGEAIAEPSGWRKVLARVISFAMHPFVLPLYLVALLVYTDLIPFAVPDELDNYVFLVVTMNALIMPAFCVMILKVTGIIRDWSLSTRKERVLPLLIVAVSYGCSGWLFGDVLPLFIIRRFMWSAFGCVVFAAVVNMFWQVSLHLTGAGGAMGALFVMVMVGYGNLLWVFAGLTLLTGLLGTARLYLRKHSLAQVCVGFAGGFAISALLTVVS